MSEHVTFRSIDGLSLDGELDRDDDARAGVVLCHPHPQMGGTMNAPLLLALRDRLVGDGIAVLRFDFRGIGASEGESSSGEAEVADAQGALVYLGERQPGIPAALAGWSFGGAVAVRTFARSQEVRRCVAVAPSVEPKAGITVGLPPPDELDAVGRPLLLVCGANDRQISVEACRAWADAVAEAAYEEIPGANHFFWAKYDDLCDAVARFLAEV